MAKTIAVSSLNLDEAAERWLTAHGARFSYSGALMIIELPKDAHVDSGPHNQEYAIKPRQHLLHIYLSYPLD
jgi:hypothetical protein